MPKVYMMCGKICSGKSTHAQKLRKEHSAVVLSVDEITLALFGQDAGEKHGKSLEILDTGINVVLDWGFWTKAERSEARQFYGSRGIETELHYIEIPDDEWYRRIRQRNERIREKKLDAYYVDDGLAAKFQAIFEPPAEAEIDIRIADSD